MKHLIAILILSCLFCGQIAWAAPANEADDGKVRSEWMKGYDAMESADRAYEAGNYLGAVKLYNDALVVFDEVQRLYPQWHASLQAFRIKYCRERLRDLDSKVTKTVSEMDEAALRELLGSQAKTMQAQMERISKLTSELAAANESLKRARAEAARNAVAGQDVKQLQAARTSLEDKVRLLENQLENAQSEIGLLKEKSQASDKDAKLKEQLKAAVRQSDEFRRENKDLKRQLEEVNGQLTRTERRRDELDRQLKEVAGREKSGGEELRAMQENLLKANRTVKQQAGQIENLESKASELAHEMQLLKERLKDSHSQSREDELLELVGETSRELQERRDEVAALEAQLQTSRDEASADRQELLSLRRAFEQLENQKNALQSDVNVYSKQLTARRHEANESKGEMEQLADDNEALQAERAKLTEQAESRGKIIAGQEAEIAGLKKELAASKAALKDAAFRIERLISAGLAEEAPEGIVQNQSDAVTEARTQKALAVQLQMDLDNALADNRVLREQVAQNEQLIQALNAAPGGAGNDAVEDLKARLYGEIKKRQELEIMLIQRDSENHVKSLAAASDSSHSAQEAQSILPVPEFSASKEQMILVNGFLRQAVEAEKNGNSETARWNYEKVLELEPENALALKRMGLMAVNAGDDSTAARYLKAAFKQNPDDSDVLLGLGYAMLQMEQPEWALAALSRAVALAPENAGLQAQFAAVLAEMHWTEAALVQYEKAWKLAPDNPDIPFNIALIQMNRCSELRKMSAADSANRAVFLAEAEASLRRAADWYAVAREKGSPADPALERLLARPDEREEPQK